ncbi:autotransporter outer membrane beta-barrel domain-containing protein [Methyloligella solikamskensis]|uniref:Autotransporter domain-containing protein n=1 Tax=Methyloligella solikamskensis TaxID=1177756 RepID=A0ABW3J8I8_9HYPH
MRKIFNIAHFERSAAIGLIAAALGAIATAAPAQTVIDSDTDGSRTTYNNGVRVENGAELTGSAIAIESSGGVPGLNVIESSSANIAQSGITTFDDQSYGILVESGAVTGRDLDIVTNGLHAYGVYADVSGADTAKVNLTGGSITTANAKGQGAQDGDGSRGYAILAEGSGASVTTNGTTIHTLGQRAYGAYAINGGAVTLNKGSIKTEGFMGYGVYASGAGSTLTANNVNITTTGYVGTAAWAYAGGRTNLNGGTLHVYGGSNPGSPHESANGLMALGGTGGSGNGVIVAKNVTVITEGANSIGALAGGGVGAGDTSGTLELSNTSIRVRGEDADAARVVTGSTLTATNSTLISEKGIGVRLVDSAKVTLNGTRVEAADATFRSKFEQSGQIQTITLGNGSVATKNNGVLLQVKRDAAGQDGQVNLTLEDGSTSSGDIVDTDPKSGGYTDVYLGAQADWTGRTFGVRNFETAAGSDATFDEYFEINGDIDANNSTYTFSQQGGKIAGNVTLTNGSSTTGGSIPRRVIVGGNVIVDRTSTLGGNWRIGGDLNSAGTISPGNSIGVINVGGDLNMTSSSVYEVEVDPDASAQNRRVEVIIVGGTANLAGRVAVSSLSGGYALNETYTILTAGSLAGTRFDSVGLKDGSVFLMPTLSYTATDVMLTIDRSNVAFASVADTRNQRSTAWALDSLPLDSAVIESLVLLNGSDARRAFDSLSGEIHASVQTTLIDDSRFVRNAAMNRISDAFDDSAAPAMPTMSYLGHSATDGLTAWGQGYGSWGSWDGSANAASVDRSIGGFVVGVDGAINPNTRLGVLAGYANSSIDADARLSSADVDTTNLGIYGGTQLGGLNLRGGLAYAWYGIDTSRNVAFPGYADSLNADYDAHSLQAFGEAGYRLAAMPANMEPFVGLAHINLDSDGFRESGGAAALQASGQSADTTFTTLGLRASSQSLIQTMPLTARGMIGWRHAFGDTDPSVVFAFTGGSSAFDVVGAPLSEDALVLEAGLDLEVGSMTTMSVSYSGQMGEDSSDHGIQGDVTLRF